MLVVKFFYSAEIVDVYIKLVRAVRNEIVRKLLNGE